MEIRLKEVTDPKDRDVERFAALLQAHFADGNLWLGPERMRAFLAESPTAARSFHLLVAGTEDRVLGGTLFSCSAATGAGFSEYMVLHSDARGSGLSRKLIERRREILMRSARERGHPGSPGVFIEVENPWRSPREFLEKERQVSMDAVERWRYFHHMGFFKLDCDYRMPPLGAGKVPIDYLDLMFCPWSDQYRVAVPAELLVRSIGPTWQAWSSDEGTRAMEGLRRSLGGKPVRLLNLESEIAKTQRRWAQ